MSSKWTNKCELAFLLLSILHFLREALLCFVMFTKSKPTIYENIVIHTATHATPEDPLICGDGLLNDKAKICNHRKFYNHYYESFIKSSWSGSISFCLFPFLFTNANNVEPLKI